MKNIFSIPFILFSLSSVLASAAGVKKATEHRHHEAHSHGSANLAIAFEATQGNVEFSGASEGILGFEHKPKNSKEQKTLDEATQLFETNMKDMVQFAPELNCQWTKHSVGQIIQKKSEGSGEHSDWQARFSIICAKAITGTQVIINFERFKKLKDIDITLIADSVQKSAEYKGQSLTVNIK